jgi:hypothetical protein
MKAGLFAEPWAPSIHKRLLKGDRDKIAFGWHSARRQPSYAARDRVAVWGKDMNRTKI